MGLFSINKGFTLQVWVAFDPVAQIREFYILQPLIWLKRFAPEHLRMAIRMLRMHIYPSKYLAVVTPGMCGYGRRRITQKTSQSQTIRAVGKVVGVISRLIVPDQLKIS